MAFNPEDKVGYKELSPSLQTLIDSKLDTEETQNLIDSSLNPFKNEINKSLDNTIKDVNVKVDSALVNAIKNGFILIWAGTVASIPDGYVLCDGQNRTPDLRDRFILGAGGNRTPGAYGGEEEHTLSIDELAKHNHTLPSDVAGYNRGWAVASDRDTVGPLIHRQTEYTGGDKPHNNMPPYYALCFIMRKNGDFISGVVPHLDGFSSDDSGSATLTGYISILQGTIITGQTIPLPAEYTQDQCKWIVTPHYMIDDETGGEMHSFTCYADSNRLVTVHSDIDPSASYADYTIIGVK